jgi:hypothetical protein
MLSPTEAPPTAAQVIDFEGYRFRRLPMQGQLAQAQSPDMLGLDLGSSLGGPRSPQGRSGSLPFPDRPFLIPFRQAKLGLGLALTRGEGPPMG